MTSNPRIAFMGTPEFAASALDALLEAKFNVVAVYSQPPKPAGRGMQLTKSAVQQLAEKHFIPVFTPKNLRNAEAQAEFKKLNLDIAVVAAYGLILPQEILDAPKHGCVNIHASLLPRWRGAAPIHRAILAGDIKTGIALMQMDAGLDTGAVYKMESLLIDKMNTGELHDALAQMGARMIAANLPAIIKGNLPPQPQPENGVTYAEKIKKEEGQIDWQKTASEIERQIRAFTPWPGAYFTYKNERIKILAATAQNGTGTPGTIIDDAFSIACGSGSISPKILQRAGKKPQSVEELLRGFKIEQGAHLL
jgi:methionyl-tRNA formyltransferase